jgi:hypothetical protein
MQRRAGGDLQRLHDLPPARAQLQRVAQVQAKAGQEAMGRRGVAGHGDQFLRHRADLAAGPGDRAIIEEALEEGRREMEQRGEESGVLLLERNPVGIVPYIAVPERLTLRVEASGGEACA